MAQNLHLPTQTESLQKHNTNIACSESIDQGLKKTISCIPACLYGIQLPKATANWHLQTLGDGDLLAPQKNTQCSNACVEIRILYAPKLHFTILVHAYCQK